MSNICTLRWHLPTSKIVHPTFYSPLNQNTVVSLLCSCLNCDEQPPISTITPPLFRRSHPPISTMASNNQGVPGVNASGQQDQQSIGGRLAIIKAHMMLPARYVLTSTNAIRQKWSQCKYFKLLSYSAACLQNRF